ncbi:TIGR03862 family flavoprotein [Limnohabitans sp.]|uniref:TIGR03862 family flavoprotein n=1 Tax=Limnohabitans sp. TaxID=1907725 RepID=UPI0033415A39
MNTTKNPQIAIIGAGPAGLMAAEVLSAAGVSVHVYDAMPSVGRKFLLAGLGGLNLTHAEPFDIFTTRYAERSEACATWLKTFDATAICEWVKGLGLDTFVGSSQRIFPTDMKAAPLLRAWLHRLRHPAQGTPVTFHMRYRWNGALQHADKQFTLSFDTPQGTHTAHADAVLLALGGGSWAKLGSDGAWQPWLGALGVDVSPLRPSNCGFDVQGRDGHAGWSSHLSSQFAGAPLKSVALSFTDSAGRSFSRRGEFVVTAKGVEGNLVYAASALLRDEIARSGSATLHLDLKPDFTPERVLAEVSHPRGTRSLSSHLKSRLNLTPLHLGLLHEVLSKDAMNDPAQLAAAIKHLPISLASTRPMDEAISSAGGVRLEALDAHLMASTLPGLFVAGEMLDWEAPTGGYLLSGCLASGRVAGLGAARLLGH